MLKPALAALLLAGCAGAPQPSTAQRLDQTPIDAPRFESSEDEAILRAIDTFLLALGNGDTDLQKSVELGDGMLAISRYAGATPGPVRRLPASQLQQPATDHDPFIERYWDPVIQVRGPIAQVWAPYELRDNGQVVHCGIDAFQLVKQDGKWMIHSSMSTMEPDACDAMRPESLSGVRPRDGWREAPLQ